jgi:SAM-dependent methyltransferase
MSPDSVLWRQAAAAGSQFDHDPAWPPQPYALPIPNAVLREASSVAGMDIFFAIGEAWAHMVSHFLPENPMVLDLGCGCGRLARFLYINPGVRYLGVDIFLPAIEWCRKAFTPLVGDRFRFEHFDGYSAVYNPTGKVKPSEYTLPCTDRSVDMTVCASLFTHLLLPDCKHYLAEIHRVLKPESRAIISLHTQPVQGTRFSGDEVRIDVEPAYFIELANDAGLSLSMEIGRTYGQDVYLFERKG